MNILLEGPDATGKTYLGNILKEALNAEYIHFTYEPDSIEYDEQIENTFTLLSHYKESNNSLIVDRFTISESVYGPIMRNEDRLKTMSSYRFHDDIEAYIPDFFDKIIFCLPQSEELYLKSFTETSNTRDEYVKDIAKMKLIYHNYCNWYLYYKSNYPDKTTRYDFTNLTK